MDGCQSAGAPGIPQVLLAAVTPLCHNTFTPMTLTLVNDLVKQSSFNELIAQVQAGNEAAAQRLFDEFGQHIMRAIRRRLHQRLRAQYDSMDFAQDVWKSFFTDAAQRYRLETPEQLIGLLTTMARNKVVESVRGRLGTRKRDLQREHSLERDVGGGDRFPGRQPTPSQIAMGREAWERLLAEQPPVYRRVLLLLREGKSPGTIAQELGISDKTVRRVILKVAPMRN